MIYMDQTMFHTVRLYIHVYNCIYIRYQQPDKFKRKDLCDYVPLPFKRSAKAKVKPRALHVQNLIAELST